MRSVNWRLYINMKASFGHILINVSSKRKSFPFYKELLKYLGWEIIYEDSNYLGASSRPADLWFEETEPEYKKNYFHRKNTGINHFSFKVARKGDVDKFHQDFLKKKGIKTLYESPAIFPDYGDNYYAVFFEDPDRIKIEVAYEG